MTNMNQTSAVIKRVIMIKTGAYSDQYIRPFTANVNNQGVLNLFVENTHGGQSIDPINIAGVAGQMLQPSAIATGVAGIINGWSQSRVRFFLEAEFTTQFNQKHTYLVQGYSDQPGFTQAGLIDPSMLLFMNNVIVLQEQAYVDPTTGQTVRRMMDTSQILYRQPATNMMFGLDGQLNQRMQTMLPGEVVQNIGIIEMQKAMNNIDIYGMTNALDTSPVIKSSRQNALASRYLAKSVTALTQSIADTSVGAAPLIDVTCRAKSLLPESPLAQDKFISLVGERTPFYENGYIRWQDLINIFPAIDSVTMCIDRQFQQNIANANNNIATGAVTSLAWDNTRDINHLESWTDASRETVVANTLGYAIPAVMMENFIAGFSFTVTNMTHTGQPSLTIMHHDTFLDNMDMTVYLQRLTSVILNEIMVNVSFNNQHTYNISMRTNILGDTYINIMLNGGIAREYLMPTFCDALTVPVVTHSQIDKDNLSSGVLDLTMAVRSNHEYLATANTNPFIYNSML